MQTSAQGVAVESRDRRYFLCASKESDSAARKADETTQGRESVFASAPKDKVKMDSGLRRNDGEKWISAFAGTTAEMDSGLRRNADRLSRRGKSRVTGSPPPRGRRSN